MNRSGAVLFVIYGATGDLASRRLFPALHSTLDPEDSSLVLGVATSDLTDDDLQQAATASLVAAGVAEDEASAWSRRRVRYHQAAADGSAESLADRITQLDVEHDLAGNRIFYLALPPTAFAPVIESLGSAGLHRSSGWVRLVVEKPFGRDLGSARQLNELTHRWFAEDQVYRIDHYLGKETVQNLLVLRFTNPVFEASWNRSSIERVEITVAETLDVGTRGRFYELTGAIGDMLQSHLTQVLTLIAMEPPPEFAADAIRDEKVKVLRSIRGIPERAVVIGQYGKGSIDGKPVAEYRTTDGVAEDSRVPTFAAVRLWIDNWRWQGVPFYLRTGKAMGRRLTEVVVTFRPPPICFFHAGPDDCVTHPNRLVLTLQPDEGFALHIEVKDPAIDNAVRTIPLKFSYDEMAPIPEAYDTLISDLLEGDQTLFVRGDETEEAWRLFAPTLSYDLPLHEYSAGSWGPPDANQLLPDGTDWATRG